MIKSVKRLGAAVLSAVMMLTAVATPLGDNLPAVRESTSLTAGAVSDYNPTAAVNYAAGHWNDGVGKCASFVSACLKAGGCGASSSLVSNLLNALTNGGYGTRYKVTASSYYAYYSQNKDKLAAGDPVFSIVQNVVVGSIQQYVQDMTVMAELCCTDIMLHGTIKPLLSADS